MIDRGISTNFIPLTSDRVVSFKFNETWISKCLLHFLTLGGFSILLRVPGKTFRGAELLYGSCISSYRFQISFSMYPKRGYLFFAEDARQAAGRNTILSCACYYFDVNFISVIGFHYRAFYSYLCGAGRSWCFAAAHSPIFFITRSSAACSS